MFRGNIVILSSSQVHVCINDVVLDTQGPAWLTVQSV